MTGWRRWLDIWLRKTMDNSAGIVAEDTLGGTREGLEGDFRYQIADWRLRKKTGQDKVQL